MLRSPQISQMFEEVFKFQFLDCYSFIFLVHFGRNAQGALLSAGQVFSASAQRGFDDLTKKSASLDHKDHFEGLFHVFFFT